MMGVGDYDNKRRSALLGNIENQEQAPVNYSGVDGMDMHKALQH